MKPDDIKLLEFLQVDEAAGSILFRNRRVLVFDADAMGLLRKELYDTLGLERTRRILARFGYARGYRGALVAREAFDLSTPEDWWRAGPRLHAVEGIVASRLLRLE